MSSASPAAPPTYLRLDPEAWEEIRVAYQAGATAAQLARQWKVTANTIYDHARKGGWGKKRAGAVVARAHRDVVAGAEAAQREEYGAYFDEVFDDPFFGDVADPNFLGQRALNASARAMQRGAFDDARRLVQMSEIYFRLAPNLGRRLLMVVGDAIMDYRYADSLFAREPGDKCIVKERYWRVRDERFEKERETGRELRRLRDKVAAFEARTG
ncbi:MAG: hypothetical protein IV086_16435 [Hyphomonadaceae bacterium]|nr:MAG: hypothetical protein FD160_1434 [Caulobacteraceae bacterium]MBT9447289.1 hypothetical protein [Hyphomonadaceae bacterium]TPW03502.1 MAG: hypothetical protein FD124_2996 [Alphaproteobacteria bacterium]